MIGIITYDTPHRKTQDILFRLILNGYSDLHLAVIPWIERKNFLPIYKHRPSHCIPVSIDQQCKMLNIEYTRVKVEDLESFFTKKEFQHILIAGAGLLPENLPKKFKIINSHPGYLPNVKGLDAYKWAIYYGQPIGATTHYISDKTDEGQMIERRIIPIYFEDTFHSVAYRIYETEIDMLVNAIKLVETANTALQYLSDHNYKANKRMPHHYEMIMINKFEEIRKTSDSHRE